MTNYTTIKIPQVIQAGDSLIFQDSYSLYPASQYTLSFVIVNAANRYTFTATADGDNYDVNVTHATTALWTAGDYQYFASVTDGTITVTVESGSVTILQSYAAAFDSRSYNKKMVDAIDAVLTGRVTGDVASYSIAGRSITKIPIAELRTMRDRYYAYYLDELKAERLARGEWSSKTIKVRFGPATYNPFTVK